MSYEDRKSQKQTTVEGYYIDVDTGMKLHYIALHYIMLQYVTNFFIYNQNHNTGVCF